MLVKDVMRRAPITVTVDDELELAAERLAWAGIHHLPVLREGRLVGIVSAHELELYRAGGDARAMHEPAAKLMRSPPPVVSPDDTLGAVAARMVAEEVDGYPVVVDDELVGIVTTTDLLLASVEAEEAAAIAPHPRRVGDAMTRTPMTVHLENDLRAAAALMARHDISQLPVVDREHQLLGLLTERSAHAALATVGDGRGLAVAAAMVGITLTTTPERPLHELASRFSDDTTVAVPVIDAHGRVVGILARGDVFRDAARAPGAQRTTVG